jgi:poly-gamma-glutamate synthesis protein (capsule biosynthesis protein)
MAVGDIMFQGSQIKAAYDTKTKAYNFDYSFKYIKDIIGGADIAVGNLECTLAGPQKPYSTNKSFNTPDASAEALSAAGFDILCTANNHSNDRGRDGLIRTVQTIRQNGMVAVGTRADTNEKPYFIADVKGVKVGFGAYTFGSRNGDLLNLYSTSNQAKQMQAIGSVVDNMRAEGADIVIVFVHWGNEYQRSPAAFQIKFAQGLADAGVDIIVGSHPHVLQSVDILTSAKTGKKTFVAYSMGDFLSNQITKWNSTLFKYTEDGMILNFHIVKQPEGGQTAVTSVEYLPTRMMEYEVGSKRFYTIIPIEKALRSPEAFDMNRQYDIKKSQKSLDDTNKLLADAVSKGYLSLMKTD